MGLLSVTVATLVAIALSLSIAVFAVRRARQVRTDRAEPRLGPSLAQQDEEAPWLKDYYRRVAQFPPKVRDAHEHSSNHRCEVAASTLCGCFYCCQTFAPSAIKEWVDPADDDLETGRTALCPFCGIDSVIGDKSGYRLTPEFLRTLNRYWF